MSSVGAGELVRVLSLNCWGLKYVSKFRKERIEAIAHALNNGSHDIIALQEIWVFADYEKVRDRVSRQLPYAKFFYSGALGAGLAIFSRWPMIASSVHPYSLNGAPIDVVAGDWFVGKAAASVVILHPALGRVQVFNTHLFAKGGEDGPEHNRAHRLVNAWQFAKLARQAAELGNHVIALGDFNSNPNTLPMTIIFDHAGLTDAWTATHHTSDPASLTASITTASDALLRLGITADSPINTWSAAKSHARGTWGKRLDYVLLRSPMTHKHVPPRFVLAPKETRVTLTELVPGQSFSHSDHFGLEAVLEVREFVDENAVETHETAQRQPSTLAQRDLSDDAVMRTVHALTACYRFSRQRARNELSIFAICLLFLITLIIGSAWFPFSWMNPMFILISVAISWLATTMLYEGFLYGNWECNALMNVIEEMEMYQKGLEVQSGGLTTSL